MGGWIKLHKKLKRWDLYTDPNAMRLFIELLITANYKDKEWDGIIIRRGQRVTSVPSLQKALGLSEKQVRLALRKLAESGTIFEETNSRYRLITIVNYNDYQGEDPEDEAADEEPATEAGRTKGRTKGRTDDDKKGGQKGGLNEQLEPSVPDFEGGQKGGQDEEKRADKRADKRAAKKEVLKNDYKDRREERAQALPEAVIQNVVNLFGDVPSLAVDDLRIWLEEEQVDSSLINEALLIGKEKGAYSWQYIRNMVESAKHRGITSGVQLRTFQANRNRPANGYRKQVTKADEDRLDQVIARAEEYRKQMEAAKCNV